MSVRKKDLKRRGWDPTDDEYYVAMEVARTAKLAGVRKDDMLTTIIAVRDSPSRFIDDAIYGPLASAILNGPSMSMRKLYEGDSCESSGKPIELLTDPVPCKIWGSDMDEQTLAQMENACRLPVSVRGAQMPDGHVGYGLPIGGVIATRNAVIPYGVGVDIGCRMKLSIMDIPAGHLAGIRDKLKNALRSETAFGIGSGFDRMNRREHDVMDDTAWETLPRMIGCLKDKAWKQLGSSGSGNHFVEFGAMHLREAVGDLPAGEYLALLSHSGSRGLGSTIADYYTKVAMAVHPLPSVYKHLAWLNLDSSAGQEYWEAMNLAGRYAAANHDCIHRHVLKAAGFKAAVQVENHHNFAWLEEHDGEELVVHRKGATPAGAGVLGVIPGSMATPGFLVRGKGNNDSLRSAAHGAGRAMSRKAAKNSFTRRAMMDFLNDKGVELLEAGLDEAPMAYKDIHSVMEAQSDLVEVIAEFHPKLVLMAPDGKAED